MSVRYVLLDFDGTLTAPEHVTDAFLAEYRAELLAVLAEAHGGVWDRALAAVRAASPQLAWTLDAYEACPVAADPYILASAVATRVLATLDRGDELRALPNDLYARLYSKHRAPFRPEVPAVLEALPDYAPRDTWAALGRPTWLRRGAFFDALADVWGSDADGPASTIFCGDIWELDLALPSALGCAVHLVERAAPLVTHEAERAAVAMTPGAGISRDLWGLVERI